MKLLPWTLLGFSAWTSLIGISFCAHRVLAQQAPFESGSTGASLSNTSGTNTGDDSVGAPSNGLKLNSHVLTLDTATLDAGTFNNITTNTSGNENLGGTLDASVVVAIQVDAGTVNVGNLNVSGGANISGLADAGTVVATQLLVKGSFPGGMTVVENNTSNTTGSFVKHFLQTANASSDVMYQFENPGLDTQLVLYHGNNFLQLTNGFAPNTNVGWQFDPATGNVYNTGRLMLGPSSGTQDGIASYLNAVTTLSYVNGSTNGTTYNREQGVHAMTSGAYTATLHYSSGVPICGCVEVAASPAACGLSADPTNTSAAFAVASGGSANIHWWCEGIH